MSQNKRIFLFVGGGLVGFAGLVALMRLAPTPRSGPKQEQPDFSRAQTWHVKGWREVQNKKIAWEIWGQTSSGFVHERVGECIRISTAQTREVFVPPMAGSPSLLIRGLPRTAGNPLSTLSSWGQPETDIQTGLPKRFVITIGSKNNGRPIAELNAQYNVPLSPNLEDAIVQKPTVTLDLQSKKNLTTTVKGTVLHQDVEGNIMLRVETNSVPPNLPLVALIDSVILQEEQEGIPVYSHLPILNESAFNSRRRSPSVTLFFVRREPLVPGQLRSRKLKLKINTLIEWSPQTIELLREKVVLAPATQNLELDLPEDTTKIPFPINSLEYSFKTISIRLDHYTQMARKQTVDSDKKNYAKKALYWLDKMFDLISSDEYSRQPNNQRSYIDTAFLSSRRKILEGML